MIDRWHMVYWFSVNIASAVRCHPNLPTLTFIDVNVIYATNYSIKYLISHSCLEKIKSSDKIRWSAYTSKCKQKRKKNNCSQTLSANNKGVRGKRFTIKIIASQCDHCYSRLCFFFAQFGCFFLLCIKTLETTHFVCV